ncbi:MAG: PAS domain-containing protein [Victivallaceae bacterium]|nr:PAS domain-containing protein [Victivallaceae bacterium]
MRKQIGIGTLPLGAFTRCVFLCAIGAAGAPAQAAEDVCDDIVSSAAPVVAAVLLPVIAVLIWYIVLLRRRLARAAKRFSSLDQAVAQAGGGAVGVARLWRQILDVVPVHVFVKDPGNGYRYVFNNEARARFYNSTAGELNGRTDFDFLPRELAARMRREDELAMNGSGDDCERISVVRGGDGRLRHFRSIQRPFTAADGSRLLLGVSVDVTESEDTKARLHNVLGLLESGSELIRSAVFRGDFISGFHIGSSRQLDEMWPCENGERILIERWVYDEDVAEFKRKLQSLIAGEKDAEIFEYRSNYYGEMRYFRARATINRENPQLPVFDGVIQDVTNISRSAGELREARELWEMVINILPMTFYVKDPDDGFRFLQCNQAFADFIGRRREDVIGKTGLELFGPTPVVARNTERDREAMASPDGLVYEAGLTDAQGMLHCVKVIKKNFVGTNGRRLLVGAGIDVTELDGLIRSERLNGDALAYAVTEPNFEKVLDHIAAILSDEMSADRVIIAQCNDNGELRLRSEWHTENMDPITDGRLAVYHKLWDENVNLMHENRIMTIPDFYNSKFGHRLRSGKDMVKQALIVSPVFVGGKLWGALFVLYSDFRRSMASIDEKLMRSMTSIIALAVIRENQNSAIAMADNERQMIFDNIDMLIWLYDADNRVVRVNRHACNLVGMSMDEIKDSPCHKVFDCNLYRSHECPVRQTLSDNRPHQGIYRRNGREYLIESRPVFDSAGRLVYVVKSGTDVTELNAAAANEKVVNFCLETLISETDMRKAITKALKAVCEHVGATRSYIFQFDHTRRTVSLFAEYAESSRSPIFGEVKDRPYSALRNWADVFADQENILVNDVLSPESSAGLGPYWSDFALRFAIRSLYSNRIMLEGKLWGYIGLIYEDQIYPFNENNLKFLRSVARFIELMLVRREAQDQIMQALAHAQAADKAKSFFIASVSHEIRTPLNAVIGFAELLRNGNVAPEVQKEYLDAIAFSGNALLQLINDVLDLSKLEADQMKIVPEPTDFPALCADVMRVFAHRAAEQHNKLECDVPPMPTLEVDVLRVRQVLFNLIGNAVKFTESGTVTLHARFSPETAEDGTLSVSVRDTGVGISPEDQEKLMKPFVQLSRMRGTNAVNNGTGLGLAISRQLVRKMGGDPWMHSEPGKGSVFGMTIHHVRYSNKPVVAPSAPAPAAAPAEFDAVTVLLVDDVAMNLKVLQAICADLKIGRVITAASGAEALAVLAKGRVDVVMTDMWMPGMDGAELLAKIRENPKFGALPVVAVTADVEAKDNFRMSGFSAVLLKPVTLENMRRILSSLTAPVAAEDGDRA